MRKANRGYGLEGVAAAALEVKAAGAPVRIYGAANIKRHIQQQKPDYAQRAKGSMADQPHEHSREIARNLRKKARAEEKAAAKAAAQQ